MSLLLLILIVAQMIDIIDELDRYGVENNAQRFEREDDGDEAWF